MYEPERSLEPPEPKGATCDGCGCLFHAGERRYDWFSLDKVLCDECAAEAARDELDTQGFRFYAERLSDALGWFDVREG